MTTCVLVLAVIVCTAGPAPAPPDAATKTRAEASAALLAPRAFVHQPVPVPDGPRVTFLYGNHAPGAAGSVTGPAVNMSSSESFTNRSPTYGLMPTVYNGSILPVLPYPTYGVLGTPVYGVPGYPYAVPGGIVPVLPTRGRR